MELERRHQTEYSVDGVEGVEGAVAVLDLSKASAYTRWAELLPVRLSLEQNVFLNAPAGCA